MTATAKSLRRAKLARINTGNQGTLGKLTTSSFSCFAIELPWRDNRNDVSCIPAGEYMVRWSKSPRLGKWTYEITGVKGRGGIRIHSGNVAGDKTLGYASDSLGCPLLGKYVGSLHGQLAVLSSLPTVAAFEREMDHQDFILEVCDA